MDIRLNGAPYTLAGASLAALLAAHDIDPARPGVAVAVNEAIVPRAQWSHLALRDGDDVEIVRPHSGG
jgi:sulfur carrier protein